MKSKIKTIIKYFQTKPEVSLVYLFGSQARKQDTPQSDIDLAVLFTDTTLNTFNLLGKYSEDLHHLLRKKTDIVSLNSQDIAFNFRVISEGQLILQKEADINLNYQTDTIKRYFDLKPTYDQYYTEQEKRARTGLTGSI